MSVTSPNRPSKGLLLPSLLGLVIIPIMLVVVALGIRHEFARSRELRAAVNHSYETRAALQTLLSLVQDAETGQRGYVITGQEPFLAPYRRAIGRLGQQRLQVATLLRERPAGADAAAARELAQLNGEIDDKLRNMRDVIQLRDNKGLRAAERSIGTGAGKQMMDAIRATIERMSEAEGQALAQRIVEDAARTRKTELQTLFGFITLGVMLIGAFLLILRQGRTRQLLLEQVQATAARMSGIFESAQDGLLTFNRSGTIESINRAGQTMFGLAIGDAKGRDAGILFELPEAGKVFLERLAGQQDLSNGVTRELEGRRADGSTFPAEVALGRFLLPDGLHVVAAVRDISDRRRVERLKSEFVSTVSHELRTPLTSIAGSLGLLAGGAAGELPARAARLISIGHSNCQRLVRLINDILDVEKIESGQMTFVMEPVDLSAVAQRSIEAMHGLGAELDVRFAFMAQTAPAMVRGDADRLAQVAANLLSNAAKFSPPNCVVSVTVDQAPNGRLRLSVEDQGAGVPHEFRDRIFSKFAQADGSDTRRLGGTGLGLAITREIVERHGGRVWFDSPPQGGATFHVELPGLEAPEPTIPISRDVVLICEDDHDAAHILAAMAQDLGLSSEVVGTAAAAKAALASGARYRALLLDLHLPDGNGLDLLRLLREDANTCSLPVLIITGDSGAAPQGLDVLDWLQKPVDINRLHAALSDGRVRGAPRPLVLHVEDDPDVRQVVADALSETCDVVAAESLSAARRRLQEIRPDLAILDIALGDGSGLELLHELRQGRDRVPVIVFSAQDADGSDMLASVDAVLTKSFTSLDDLARMVGRLVSAEPEQRS